MSRLFWSLLCFFLVTGKEAARCEAFPRLVEPGAFADLGVAAPLIPMTGAVATLSPEGERLVVLMYSGTVMVVNVDRGTQDHYPEPDIKGERLGGFNYLLTSSNRLYLVRNGYLFEFDVNARAWSAIEKTPHRAAMSMTEGPDGVVYIALYPDAQLLSYDPEQRQLHEITTLYEADWPIYVSRLAFDAEGWLYAAIGYKMSTIVAVRPGTDETVHPFVPEESWKGPTTLHAAADGSVIAGRPIDGTPVYRLRGGKRERLEGSPPAETKGAGKFGQVRDIFSDFGDGSRIERCLFVERVLEVRLKEGRTISLRLDYPEPVTGRTIYSLTAGPDGAIYGSTGLPLRLFRFDPYRRTFTHHGSNVKMARGHINTLLSHGDTLYGGSYSGGYLMAYQPARPWEAPFTPEGNPRLLTVRRGAVNRPHAMVLRDERHLVMGGTPAYGATGAGLLLYDLKTGIDQTISDQSVVPGQSTFQLVALPDGGLIGGCTLSAGTGGVASRGDAALYAFDWEQQRATLIRHPIPDAVAFHALCLGAKGRIYGLARVTAERSKWEKAPFTTGKIVFFVAQADTLELLHSEDVSSYGQPAGVMAPDILRPLPSGQLLALFREALVTFDPEPPFGHRKLATPPGPVSEGWALANGQLFYTSGSHLMVYGLP